MLTTDRVAGGALVLVGLVAVWESRQFPLGSIHRPGPAYMPTVLALLLIVFGVLVALMGARSQRVSEAGWHDWRHAIGIFAACAFSAWGLNPLGYRITVACVLVFLLLVLERRGILLTAVLTVGIVGGSFYLFDTLLRVPLPRGPFGF
jgi:hypothetical protein